MSNTRRKNMPSTNDVAFAERLVYNTPRHVLFNLMIEDLPTPIVSEIADCLRDFQLANDRDAWNFAARNLVSALSVAIFVKRTS